MKYKNQHITEQMRISIWEHELQNTYEEIIEDYNIKNLIQPAIKIVEASSYWGLWDPLNLIIKINKKLICDYPWDTVINVLKHEMAHQLDQNNCNKQENFKSHGPGFLNACEQLRVPKEFQSSKLDNGDLIPSWKDSDGSTLSEKELESQNLIRRIEKLLSLAQSNNENEAMAAMEKVFQIYEQYNIERIEDKINLKANLKIDSSNSIICLVINLKKKKIETYQNYIFDILKRFYFVKVIYSHTYDPFTFSYLKSVEIFGAKENVKMAEYVFYFLENKIQDLWLIYKKNNKVPTKFKRSYMVGVLSGFISKLDIIKKQSNINSSFKPNRSQLLIQSESEIDLFIKNIYPSLALKKVTHSGMYGDAFQSGQSEGKNIIINKGIENSNNSESKTFFLN